MQVTGIELIPVFSTREMGRTGPSDPQKSVSYHVIVRLHTDAGITGLGEMSDIEFAADREAVMRLRSRLEPLLVGRSPFDLTAIQVALGRHSWEHQVLCGVDIALHDAVARALRVPLYQLFGGRYREKIPFSYPLGACKIEADIDANLERIERLQDQGHDTIRYYFGADLDLDERFLSELRRRWGDGVKINALDASGRFDVESSIKAIRRLTPFRPNLVESPVNGRHNAPVEDFLAVKQAVALRIGEHITDSGVASRLARHDAIDVFNTGLGYSGITSCLKTFAVAEFFGVKTLMGSTVELSIGTAARVHVASAVPNLDFPIYPSGPLVYREQVVKEKVKYEEGHVLVPEGPGLGMEIDEDLLDAQRV